MEHRYTKHRKNGNGTCALKPKHSCFGLRHYVRLLRLRTSHTSLAAPAPSLCEGAGAARLQSHLVLLICLQLYDETVKFSRTVTIV